MEWTETRLSKGIDAIYYFQISYCVSYIKTYLILGHQKVLAQEQSNAMPQKDFESFLCWTATYLASE